MVDTYEPWLDPNAKPFVRISAVSKSFGDVVAVDKVALDIYQGELFCLLGGSGCGKSTLLRMLAGFEELSSGSITIDGEDMAGVPAYRRPTNMMFQSYALFPHMSVERNIAYGLARAGLAKAAIADRVVAMLRLVQLESYARRKPSQLSGGQKQRVALARALAKNPKLLLLDEPLAALDKKLREETQFELVNIQEETGITFVVVTHDQEEAMTLATRIGVMEAGKIAQVGEPREIYEFPNSRFVANFIGSVNMFSGQVRAYSEAHVRIASSDAQCEIYVGHGISCLPNQQLWFALRPEKIRIGKDKPQQAYNCTSGVVEDIAYVGNSSVYVIKLANSQLVRVTRSNSTRDVNDDITWEDQVYISWGEDAGVVLTA